MKGSLLTILKSLSDENRLRILALLSGGETCVCNIESGLGLTQSNVSRHLSRLRISGLIESRKRGLFVYYRLKTGLTEKFPFLKSLLSSLADEYPGDGSCSCKPRKA